jgi:uncharacterized cupin superfamily protein
MPEAKSLENPLAIRALTDWGPVAVPLGEPVSRTAGLLLFRNPDQSSEMGLWECTPGSWRCEVERDEFCYFLAGRCTYSADSGEVIKIAPGTAAAFPAGWKGDCEVIETVRKVYMVR